MKFSIVQCHRVRWSVNPYSCITAGRRWYWCSMVISGRCYAVYPSIHFTHPSRRRCIVIATDSLSRAVVRGACSSAFVLLFSVSSIVDQCLIEKKVTEHFYDARLIVQLGPSGTDGSGNERRKGSCSRLSRKKDVGRKNGFSRQQYGVPAS